MKYLIMNKDVKVAIITYNIYTKSFTVLDCLSNFIVPLTDKNITAWIYDRRTPPSRMFANALYSKFDIQDIRNYINLSNGVSLNDTFWIKPVGSDLIWARVSPYTNPLSQLVASTMMGYGNLCNSVYTNNLRSPDLSTDGKFAKCWQRRNNTTYLLKRGQCNIMGIDGREPFSEYFTFQVGKALGIQNIAEYSLGKYRESVVSVCTLFTSEKYGFLPLSIVLGDKSPEEELIYMKSINSEMLFRELMLLDCITLNYDRHLNNMGVLINNSSLKVIRFAPVFDNNLALVPSVILKNKSNEDVWRQIRNNNVPVRNFTNFLEQALFYLTPSLAVRLEALLHFKLSEHKSIKTDKEYVEFAEGLVRYNTRLILDVYHGRRKLDPLKSTYTSPFGLI